MPRSLRVLSRPGGLFPLLEVGLGKGACGQIALRLGNCKPSVLCCLGFTCDSPGPGSTSGAYNIRAAYVREGGWLGRHRGKVHMRTPSQGGATASTPACGCSAGVQDACGRTLIFPNNLEICI